MRKAEKWLIGIGVATLGFMSIQPVFLDPFKHERRVNFWEWLGMEIDELLHGERNNKQGNNEQKKEYVYH